MHTPRLDAERGSALLRDAILRCIGIIPQISARKKPRYVSPQWWTEEDHRRLASYASAKLSSINIAARMGRSPAAIRAKARRLGLSLDRHRVIKRPRPADISQWSEADKISEWAEVPQELAELVVDMANARGVKVSELRGPSRQDYLVSCRKDISVAARKKGYSFPKIGRALNRDHTSVIFFVNSRLSPKSTARSASVPSRERSMIAA